MEAIVHFWILLLFNIANIWIKKDSNKGFDKTMGGVSIAKICELVCLYTLFVITEKYGKRNY